MLAQVLLILAVLARKMLFQISQIGGATTAWPQNQTGVIIAALAVVVCFAWTTIASLPIRALAYGTSHISWSSFF